jgi:hypothetical protein
MTTQRRSPFATPATIAARLFRSRADSQDGDEQHAGNHRVHHVTAKAQEDRADVVPRLRTNGFRWT